MSGVLLDTGCIVALLDRRERHHPACVAAIESLSDPLVTCEAVIAEACHLLRSSPGAREAILANVESGKFQIPFRLDRASGLVRTLIRQYARVPMSLADACLVHLADELDTGRILTLDADFRVYRWRRTRSFDLLIDVDANA